MNQQDLSQLEPIAILGATRGIGLACARALAQKGARRLILVGRDPARLKRAEQSVREVAHRDLDVQSFAVDLTDPARLAGWLVVLEDLPAYPRHWVFSAGGSVSGTFTQGPFESYPWAELESQLRLNFEMPLRVTHAVLPELLRPMDDGESAGVQGSLIYLSSQAAHYPRPGHATYAAAKSGLSHFAESLFEEVRERGVRVSVISPGMTDTPLLPDQPHSDRGRYILPETVAEAVTWALACDPRTCPFEIRLKPQRDPGAR